MSSFAPVQLRLGPVIQQRGPDGPLQPVWGDVRLYSPEWYRRFRDWTLDTYPDVDPVTRENLDMLIRHAEGVTS